MDVLGKDLLDQGFIFPNSGSDRIDQRKAEALSGKAPAHDVRLMKADAQLTVRRRRRQEKLILPGGVARLNRVSSAVLSVPAPVRRWSQASSIMRRAASSSHRH